MHASCALYSCGACSFCRVAKLLLQYVVAVYPTLLLAITGGMCSGVQFEPGSVQVGGHKAMDDKE